MKPILTSMYNIWNKTTISLLDIKEISTRDIDDEKVIAVGWQAWDLIFKCSKTLDEDAEATAAYWASWGGKKVTHKEIAKVLSRHRKRKTKKGLKQNVMVNDVKSLLSKARKKIQICIDKELSYLRYLNE
jgi:hypothetical protein